jgi:hypothetical protein
VVTFEGRAGIVTSVAGDYDSDEITNVSTVTGATVTLALNNLAGDITTVEGDIVDLTTDKVSKGGDTDGAGLVIGTNDAFSLTLRANSANLITLNSAGTIALSGVAEDAAQTRMLTLTPGTGVITYRNYPNLITAFNGRTATDVVPTAGDYGSDDITNESEITGATVSDAIETLDGAIDTLTSTVNNKLTNGGDAGPVTVGTNDAQSLTLEVNNTPRIVLGAGAGEVTVAGLTESVLGTHFVKQDPATGRLYATPTIEATLIDISEMPLVTWASATTVTVGAGAAICRSIVDNNSKRLWHRYLGIANITATLPVGVSASQTVYLYVATNGTNDPPSDTAFFSTTNPPKALSI